MQIEKISEKKCIVIPDEWIVWKDMFGNIVSVESPDGRIFNIEKN